MELGISATTMEFDEFCRFQKKYKNQIMKIQRKMDYFLFREQNFIKEDRFLEDLFLESILVDVRALLMENARYKNNYTLQNTFKINSSNEEDIRFKVASGIDDLLKEMLLRNFAKFRVKGGGGLGGKGCRDLIPPRGSSCAYRFL